MKKFIGMILTIVLLISGVFYVYEKSNEKIDNEEVNNISLGINNEHEVEKQEETLEIDNSEQTLEGIKEETSSIEYINIDPLEVSIPILMYHSISDSDPNNSLLVPPVMFDEQMAWFVENGFTAMTLDELMDSMSTGKVPKRPVVITFDDGYADNYHEAFPILKKYELKATFFVITNSTDTGDYYMSSDMLREMQQEGMKIENHTANHLELNQLSYEDQLSEIRTAQEFLRNNIGAEGNYLCYPVGRYDDSTIEAAKELGIKAAVTTQGGISTSDNGYYELKRVRVSPMSIEGFASIFSEYMY